MSVINVTICAGTAIGEYAVVVAFLYRRIERCGKMRMRERKIDGGTKRESGR